MANDEGKPRVRGYRCDAPVASQESRLPGTCDEVRTLTVRSAFAHRAWSAVRIMGGDRGGNGVFPIKSTTDLPRDAPDLAKDAAPPPGHDTARIGSSEWVPDGTVDLPGIAVKRIQPAPALPDAAPSAAKATPSFPRESAGLAKDITSPGRSATPFIKDAASSVKNARPKTGNNQENACLAGKTPVF